MTIFFGDHWGAPILEYAESAPTPVGVVCYLCDRPIHRGDQGFIRPLITENGPGGHLPVHRGCDMAVTIGHLFGVCSCTGWDDIYERGQELVRQDDKGLLKPHCIRDNRMTKAIAVQCQAISKQTGRQCKRKAIPGGTVCRWHGGAAGQVKAKAAIRAEVLNWGLGNAHVDPGEVLLRLVTQSAARAEHYSRLLQDAFQAAERLKQAHDAGAQIQALDDELADTAETARRDLDRIFNTGEWQPWLAITYGAAKRRRCLRHRRSDHRAC